MNIDFCVDLRPAHLAEVSWSGHITQDLLERLRAFELGRGEVIVCRADLNDYKRLNIRHARIKIDQVISVIPTYKTVRLQKDVKNDFTSRTETLTCKRYAITNSFKPDLNIKKVSSDVVEIVENHKWCAMEGKFVQLPDNDIDAIVAEVING